MNEHRTPHPDDLPRTFDLDLTRDELRRREAFLAAMGEDWDPLAVLAGEREAYRLLYSGLDEEQAETYRRLVAAGVLPDRDTGPGGPEEDGRASR
ncbi:DUF6400 family protein [Streptomyces sp. NPDC059740]|uniref:DUF6400 family protein n=1 Tax=Streptomyces sp. NPDC059740 TaxID=3346926 RepID=UPI003656FA2F